ncbi:TonB-dependent receptor [Novosphingobium sp. BL-8H]|uniref:TonB-dependent receptor n=1 Tax=Novosphingobium sp. BL-8H TaxID=3127640 RepID=UPI00375776F8
MNKANIARNRGWLLCCAASAIALPQMAWAAEPDGQAQDASAQAATSVNEIIVSATRQQQTLQDTPMAVDVVTADAVSKLNVFDAKEIQNLSPGLQLTNNDGRSNIATLRGVTFDPDSGSSPAVEIFLNEVPTDAQTVFTAIYDVGQIEVLRGPQGLFRGRTSPAGSILLGTQKANVYDFTGYAQGTATDRHAINAQVAANLPIVPGVLGMRAALLYDQNRVGSVTNVDGRHSSSKTMSGRVSFALDAGPLTANLMYQHLNADTTPFVAVFGDGNQPSLALGDPTSTGPVLTLKDRKSVTEGDFRFQNRTDFVTFNAAYDFGGPRLVYNGGYQNSLLKQERDQDVGNAVPNYVRNQSLATGYKIWNNELRLESAPAARFSWALSGNYRWQDNSVPLTQSNDQLFALMGVGPIPPSVSYFPIIVDADISVKLKEYGLAGTLGYKITDDLKITAGLRHTWTDVHRVQSTVVSLPDFGISLPATVDDATQKARAFTGGANISWQASPDITAYASYGHSFRPGVFAVGVTTPLDPSLLQTKDETSDGGEIGVKFNLLRGKVALNVAGFYQKFSNYISYFPSFHTASARDGVIDSAISPLPFTGNAISQGAEIQLSVRPTENIDFSINASYADAHFDNAVIPCNTYDAAGNPTVPVGQQISTCQSKDRLAQIPKFNLSANGEFRMPVGSVTPFLRGLVTYRPGFNSLRDNYSYRDYVKMDLFLGVRGENGRWEVNLFAKNLLNQTRALSVGDSVFTQATSELDFTFNPTGAGGIPFNSGYRTATITPPREFGLTTIFRW